MVSLCRWFIYTAQDAGAELWNSWLEDQAIPHMSHSLLISLESCFPHQGCTQIPLLLMGGFFSLRTLQPNNPKSQIIFSILAVPSYRGFKTPSQRRCVCSWSVVPGREIENQVSWSGDKTICTRDSQVLLSFLGELIQIAPWLMLFGIQGLHSHGFC